MSWGRCYMAAWTTFSSCANHLIEANFTEWLRCYRIHHSHKSSFFSIQHWVYRNLNFIISCDLILSWKVACVFAPMEHKLRHVNMGSFDKYGLWMFVQLLGHFFAYIIHYLVLYISDSIVMSMCVRI